MKNNHRLYPIWLIAFLLLCFARAAWADTPLTLIESFAGNINFVGTQRTLRTAPNGGGFSACTVSPSGTTLSATLSGIPATATIVKAYLYWAGSGATPDNTVTFETYPFPASRQYTSATDGTASYFSGVADVTYRVDAKRNGTYSFSGLTVTTSGVYCSSAEVVGGWALLVIYSDVSQTFRVLNLYEGFQYFWNATIPSLTINLSNFKTPNPIGSLAGKIGHITWEGDPTLSGGGENLTFNGTAFSDSNNPIGNQFNSYSNINGDANSYGIDFDAYSVASPLLTSGQTTATSVYSTGTDFVLLSAEIVAVPNVPVTDLTLTKTFSSGTMAIGQTVAYTLTVKNNGPSHNTPTGLITITDTLPTGLTYVSAVGSGWTCGAAGQIVTCNRSLSLPNGALTAGVVLTATVNASAPATVTNTASVTGAMFDNIPANNTVSNSQTLVPVADLALGMGFSGTMGRGLAVSYTLTASNNGPASEPGPIRVVNTLPAGLTYVSASGTGWVCGVAGQVVTCTRSGSLASGATASAITLSATVGAGASGTITNSATLTGTRFDSPLSNNTATDSRAVVSADLALSMGFTGTMAPGLAVSYTLTASNNGPASEPGPIRVVDTLPAGLTYVLASGTGWVCAAVGQVVTCTRSGSLASSAAAAAITLNATVGAGASGTLTNSATLAGTQYDSVSANNTATDSRAVVIPADLALSMGFTGTMAHGQTVTYTLTANNNGPASEPGPISVVDTLPAGLTYVLASGTGWVCGAVGQVVTCTRSGVLASGATANPITLSVLVGAGASGTMTNSATVTGTQYDTPSANNTATNGQSTVISSDLAIVMTRVDPLVGGQNARYTLVVSNGGPDSEPGPITVTDILPSGLTYVSASGTNWTCNASVSCSYGLSLANGASAPALTLTVAVSGTVVGTITNTASVAGTHYDSNNGNNSSSDAYSITAYASYTMDESSWNGTANEVVDSSGSGHHATAVGVTTVATPSAGAKGNTCRGADIPADSAAGTQKGVNTGFDLNNLGNAGTIGFWYKSNTSWSNGTAADDRTLLDASTASARFFLVLQQSGILHFVLDGAASPSVADSGVYSTAAKTWVHIAITWSFTGTGNQFMRIYVDGVLAKEVADATITSNPGYGNLLIGDTLAGLSSNYSANGVIDEVQIYDTAFSQARVQALQAATHVCPGPDHYELSLPASALTCLGATATVTACADNSSPCTNKYASASGGTAVLTSSAGIVGGGTNTKTVTFDATGVTSTSLDYPSASDGSVTLTLSGESIATGIPNSRECCKNGSSCTVANFCSIDFSAVGFMITDAANNNTAVPIASQIAGTNSADYYLRAVKANDKTKACESALGAGSMPVNFAYQCNNPTICSSVQMGVNIGASQTAITSYNDGTTPSTYQTVNMQFDGNGSAPFSINFKDVGQVTLFINKTINSVLLAASNQFVVKPADFVLSNIVQTASPNKVNPEASAANGAAFVGAGQSFSVTVTAVTSGNVATPNFGKETSPATVCLADTTLASRCGHGQLVVPAGGANPAISGGFGAFANGAASGSAFTWNEVGILRLRPALASGPYLGTDDVIGSTSKNVGRFYPDHFDTVVSGGMPCVAPLGSCPNPPSQFVYSGQPFTTNVIARSGAATPTTTVNYDNANGLSRAVTLSASNAAGGAVLGAAVGTLNDTAIAATAFVNGETTIGTPATPNYALPIPKTNPTNIFLRAIETAGDAVSSLQGGGIASVEGGIQILSGRLLLANTYGSELLQMKITGKVQFYNSGWVTNLADSNTQILPGNFVFSSYTKQLSSVSPLGTVVAIANGVCRETLTGIVGPCVTLAAPGAGKDGSVDITLHAPIWLPSNTIRATFGLYRAGPVIYIREIY